MAAAPPSRWWGALTLFFFGAHAALHLRLGHPERLLWACHLSNVAIGIGFLARSPLLNGIGYLWLTLGIPLWFVYLARGGELFATSPFTHFGGLAIAIYGIRRLGLPQHLWAKTLVVFILLNQICRWTTPPLETVNLAYDIWAGEGEAIFTSYLGYVTALLALGGLGFFCVEWVTRKAFSLPGC